MKRLGFLVLFILLMTVLAVSCGPQSTNPASPSGNSSTPTVAFTGTPSPTTTSSATATPTITRSSTRTYTATSSSTPTLTSTYTVSPVFTATLTQTFTSTTTSTITGTPQCTVAITSTPLGLSTANNSFANADNIGTLNPGADIVVTGQLSSLGTSNEYVKFTLGYSGNVTAYLDCFDDGSGAHQFREAVYDQSQVFVTQSSPSGPLGMATLTGATLGQVYYVDIAALSGTSGYKLRLAAPAATATVTPTFTSTITETLTGTPTNISTAVCTIAQTSTPITSMAGINFATAQNLGTIGSADLVVTGQLNMSSSPLTQTAYFQFATTKAGNLTAYLDCFGGGYIFNLFDQNHNLVANSTGSSTVETISHAIAFGTYYLEVYASSGSGNFTLHALPLTTLAPASPPSYQNGWTETGSNITALAFDVFSTDYLYGSSGTGINYTDGSGISPPPSGFASGFNGISGLTANTNVFVADGGANKVIELNSSGVSINGYGNGTAGNGANELNLPQGSAPSGAHVVVADTGNDRIVVLNSDYTYNTSSDGSASGQAFSQVYDVCSYGATVYALDRGLNRVVAFDDSGNFKFQFGGTGTGNGNFNSTNKIATDGTSIYVADTGNYLVQKFSMRGDFITQWGGYGAGNSQFGQSGSSSGPLAVAADGTSVYVADGILIKVFK